MALEGFPKSHLGDGSRHNTWGTIVKFRDLSSLTPSNCPSWGALGSLRGVSYQRVETELNFLTWVVGIRTLPGQ